MKVKNNSRKFQKQALNLDFNEIAKWALLVLTVFGIMFAIQFAFVNITNPNLVNIVLVLPFIFFLTPFLFYSLYAIKKVEAKMQVIPRFLRDVVDNVDSGMDLVTAISNTVGNEYTVLNDDIRKLVNQLSWGIDFQKALLNFSNNIGSKSLKRDFLLVVEARKVGGHVEKILRELSEKINIENLRIKERKSNLASNTFTGYVSFIIFLLIIILTYNNLFLGIGDTLSQNGGATQVEGGEAQVSDKILVFLTLIMLLSYELAILSGFLFGLMQQNNIVAGAPHVVILVVITFIGFFGFIK